MAKQVQLRGGTTTQHSTFIGAEREVTVDTDKNTLVVHDGLTPGGIVLATEDYVDTSISGTFDDITPATDKVYSSDKVQQLHDAQATAIANLAGAGASFYNNGTQPIPEAPSAFVDLTWTNGQASTNTDIFELGVNSIIFKGNGVYNFFSTVTFYRLASGATATVTFEIYDSVTNTVLATTTTSIDMAAGTKITSPMNTLLEITGLPSPATKTVKVRMQATAVTGTIELFSFNSILALSSVGSTTNIAEIDAALGTIYEGLA